MIWTLKHLIPVLALAAPLLTLGCYAGVAGRGPSASYDVVVGPAPIQVETYPYVVYEGAPSYYVEGRWYRRSGNGWGYYRQEPAYLQTRRPVTRAPPAYGPGRGGPGYGPPPGRTTAPPAHRR